MMTLIAVSTISLLAALLFTPCIRVLAVRFGLVDRPDGRRKMHSRPTPVAGGIAILASVCLAIPAVHFFEALPLTPPLAEDQPLTGLLIAAIVICAVGVLDDYGVLRGRHKLLGQLLAIVIVMCFGVSVQRIHLFQWEIELGLVGPPFTAFLLLGAINSLNLLDGMDGMLGCVGLIIVSAMAVMAVLCNHWAPALVAAALAGALLGFLPYNFPPASIFLGDCGSMLIGLAVGVLAIQSSLKGPATAALAAPLVALTIPIMDTAAAIIRRKLTGRSLYTSDRGHLHHCLLNRGFSTLAVLACVSFLCLCTVIGALASLALRNELVAILTAVTVVTILIGIRLFGYAEFLLARNRLLATISSLLHIRPKARPHGNAVHLQGSVSWKEIWGQFTDCAVKLNLKTICLDLNAPFIHEGYHAQWQSPGEDLENSSLWFAEIPLMARGQVVGRLEVAGRHDQTPVWAKIADLTKLVEGVESIVADRAMAVEEKMRKKPNLKPAAVNLEYVKVS